MQQTLNTKCPENLGHQEKTQTKNNRNRSPAQRHRKYIQQNLRRKLFQTKEGYAS